MAVHILILFALGFAGLLRWEISLILCLPAVLALKAIPAISRSVRSAGSKWASLESQHQAVVAFAVFYLGVFAFITGLSIVTPTTNGDAVRAHLGLAKMYLQTGNIEPAPFLDYSYNPQAFEVLMSAFWSLGGQPAAQMLNPLQFIALLLIVYGIGREIGASPLGCVLGLSIAATVPFLHWTGSVVKNDAAATLFLLAALACYLLWFSHRSLRHIYLMGFFIGSSFGVKATALFGALPLAFLAAYGWWQHGNRARTAAVLCDRQSNLPQRYLKCRDSRYPAEDIERSGLALYPAALAPPL
jgi:hypothetical protein